MKNLIRLIKLEIKISKALVTKQQKILSKVDLLDLNNFYKEYYPKKASN